MSILLEAVKFNYAPQSSTSDAFSIRLNASEFLLVPEWRRGETLRSGDSPAAYAMEETNGQDVLIQAQFRSPDLSLAEVEVRAIDVQGHNVLGEVEARRVRFPAGGLTEFETFRLRNVGIQSRGVGVWDIEWLWQFRNGQGLWEDFETTRHRIYVVVAIPKLPWVQENYAADSTQLPWLEVLDYACRWAMGARDVPSAVAQIVASVNSLGGTVIRYDCPGGGRTHYCSSDQFYCTRFLGCLRGDLGRDIYVDCTDCATIVSTFSNILGADLSQLMIVPRGESFRLNPVMLIGTSTWEPCLDAFSFHEVAWRGPLDVNGQIFDACLRLDGDDDPTTADHVTPLLPVGLRFGLTGAMLYRDRLVFPPDRLSCSPARLSQQRTVC